MNALYWREPLWALLGLLPLLWLSLGAWRAHRLRQRYADPALWPWALSSTSPSGSRWRRAALLLAWLLLGLAAAGPRLPAWLAPDQDHSAASVLLVLDLSHSMDAQDVWPTRRRLALRALDSLLPNLAGSRVGLVVVAGHAHLLWPASNDRDSLRLLLSQLGELQPPSQGSNLAEGVRLATAQLAAGNGTRILLMLSDGDMDGGELQALTTALQATAEAGTRILFAGVGTPGGAALPASDGSWLQQAGQTVISRLDAPRLAALVGGANGSYLTLPEQAPADALLAQLPTEVTRLRIAPGDAVLWQELFPWLLLPAGLLWLVASLRLPAFTAPTGIAITGLYLLGLLLALPVRADTLSTAYQALQAGDLARARTLYAELPGYAGRMGSGYTCHQLGDWACARQAFAQAVLTAADDDSRARAVYNLAHSVFQDGDFAAAAGLFDDALRYRSDYPAARHNRDFASDLAAEVARLAGGPQADRPGRGSATAATGDTAIPADARLSLDSGALPPASQPDRAATRQALLDRGLAFTRLTQAQSADAASPWGRQYGGRAAPGADITLWQTLMERAEGLPATPSRPRTLPGVRPW